jgi:hypothetical protein
MIALKTVSLARPRPGRKPSDARYSVSDGRDARGVIAETVTGFTAVTTAGVIIGEFTSLREAARAFPTGGER